MNRQRVQRLWREEGLRVPAKHRKRQRLGDSAQPAARLRAERPDHVWALDFQFDQTADGRVLKLLNIVDEHTREALAVVVARHINADATAATLDRIVAARGTAPGHIRCDNGPELTANSLRDWCRFQARAAATSSPVRRGRTRTWSRSTAGSATSSWPSSSSTACSRRRCSSRTGGSSTTRHARTAAWPALPGCLRRALGGSATRWTLISGGLARGSGQSDEVAALAALRVAAQFIDLAEG